MEIYEDRGLPATRHGSTWSRGTALPIIHLGAKWGWVVNATPRQLYLRVRAPVPREQEAG